MESNLVKGMAAFVLVMIVGFVIVGTTRETKQEKVQGVLLQTSGMLHTLALNKCSDVVTKEIGGHPYTPKENTSDGMSWVTLVWYNVGNVQRAECRYVIDQGIILLKLDDRIVIEKTENFNTAPAAPKSAHH